MTASQLIAILQKVDPNAEIFTEFEGQLVTMDREYIRVGRAALVCLIETSPSYPLEPYTNWYDAGEDHSPKRTVRECEGVVLGYGGEFSTLWPQLSELGL